MSLVLRIDECDCYSFKTDFVHQINCPEVYISTRCMTVLHKLNWTDKVVENYPDKICQFGDQMSCESWCYENLDILWPVGPVWCQSDMLGCIHLAFILS